MRGSTEFFGFHCLRQQPQTSKEARTPRGAVILGKSPALNAVGSLAAMPRGAPQFGAAVGPVSRFGLGMGLCTGMVSTTSAGPSVRPLSRGNSQGVAAAAFGVLGDITSMVQGGGNRRPSGVQDESLIRAACAAMDLPETNQDPQKVTEYASDVIKRLLRDESACLPNCNYMDTQTDINAKMRSILVDWLAEVHMKYEMQWETLFLAVNIIDRYLSVRKVQRSKLQLLGVVAMFIAAKYEEIDPPRAQEFAYITDHTYSKKEVVELEARVLMALNFRVVVPTPAHFLEPFADALGCDDRQKALARYILERSFLDLRSLRYQPSVLVSAALLLSNEILGKQPSWPAAMMYQTGRSEGELRPCVSELSSMVETASASQLQAINRKYRLDQHFNVANLVPQRA